MRTFTFTSHGKASTGGGSQSWTNCPKCGAFYQEGEQHVCSGVFMQSSTSTAQGHWKCSICGQSVPYGEVHICNGSNFNPSALRPIVDPEERRVRALERIADALEKLQRGAG